MGQARDRYRIERPLGQGGMGAVVLAFDAEMERHVALKRAHRVDAPELLRFKREFRAIAGLTHPNLVRLYELGLDERGLFFTMEPIDGADLVAWCSAGDRVERLRIVLPQLLAALSFLHARGVVHCDLKPSNVLVDANGTLKLLDFGMLAALSSAERDVAGTPAYIAPERIRGEPATPAADAYALGCTLFEIAAGRPPFVGTSEAVLTAHVERDAPPLSAMAPEVPPRLAEACARLLAKDPRDRIAIEDLARLLALDVRGTTAERRLVGREDLQAELEAWLAADGGPRVAVLAGATGTGKSALLDWIGERASARGVVVLRSGARATERLAYNALDAAMDDLARELLRSARSAVDPRALRVASEAFPVLRPRCRTIDAAREEARFRLFGWREQLERCSRPEIFDAVVSVLGHVAQGRGTLLTIDDFQWADADSVALTRHLVEHAPAGLRTVLAVRDDVAPAVAAEWLAAEDGLRLPVSPLAPPAIARIVRDVATSLGATPTDERIADAARGCEGRPFLAEVAARALVRGELDALGATSELDRRVLALVLAADGWTRARTIASILRAPLGAIDDSASRLATEGMVRRVGAGADAAIDLYHDRIRARLLERMPESERLAAHSLLADELTASGGPAAALVRHLLACGRADEATTHALRAADAAEEQRAFSLAADMIELALRARGADHALHERRAWLLERAGRYADASVAWRGLATSAAERERRLDARLHEAHALIAASRTAEGIRTLEAALVESGRPDVRVRGVRAIATLARFALGPVRIGRPAVVDAGLRRRAERHLQIGILLAFLDPLTGISYLQRAHADFLRSGGDAQAAGCDYVLAVLALAGSPRVDRVPLAERYLAAARARASGLALAPDVRGLEPFVVGLGAMRQGRWSDARSHFADSIAVFQSASGTTELAMARSFDMMMTAHAQDFRACRALIDWFHRHAAECGGTLLSVHLRLVEGYVAIFEGRFDESFDLLTRSAESLDHDRPSAQRASKLIYRHAANVYRDARAARAALEADLAAAKRFRFMRTMYAGLYASLVAMIEANALRAGDPRASVRKVERLAAIADRSPPFSAGSASRARAYAADAAGHPERAVALLVRAEHEADRYQRHVDRAIARWQRGRRIGGDEGARLCASARAETELHGASPLVLEEDAGLR